VSAHSILKLRLSVGLLVLLWHQEGGTLNPVHLHELIARLRHGLVACLFLLEIVVEIHELVVLLEDILHIGNLHLSCLCDLLFLF
jgi:hypothetical protein